MVFAPDVNVTNCKQAASKGARRGKTCQGRQAREMHEKFQFICRKYVVCARRGKQQRLPSAGKQAAISKRGKTSNDCQARENKQRLLNAGKQATIAKRGENKQRLPSAGKQATGVKRWKTIDGFRECKNHAMNVKRMLLAEKEF